MFKHNKRKSVLQERRAAEAIGGRVQPGSGAPEFYKGDVRKAGELRVECKTTSSRSFVLKLPVIEKIKAEALRGGDEGWALQVEFQTVSGNKKFAVVDWQELMNLRNSLDSIAELLSGKEWEAGTLDEVAKIIRDSGRRIDEP